MNILIVDDRQENRYLLESLLTGNGYHTFSAPNGKAALQILDREKIDLIISDILMPEMDGFQLCRECKKAAKLKDIPFVFYTATYTSLEDEEFALKLGADRFIRKPVEPDKFLEQIKALMRSVRKGEIQSQEPKYQDEDEVLKLYNERLVEKLEHKMQKLEESEANLRVIFENSPESFILIDTDYKIRFFNKIAIEREKRVIGKEMKIGDSFLKFLNPQEKKDFTRNFQRALAGEKVTVEREIKSKDGNGIWFEFHYSPVYDKEGGAIGVFFVVNDINDRKQTEIALKDREMKYRTIFDTSTNAIFLMKNDRFIDCNTRTLEMFNCKKEDIINATPYEIFSPAKQPDGRDSKEKALEKINDALEGNPQRFEWTHCTKEGKAFITEVSLNRYSTNDEVFIMAVVHDITERKRAEETIAKQNRFHQLHAELWKIANELVKSEFELIDKILAYVGPAIEVSRATYVRLDPEKKKYVVECQWYDDQYGPSPSQTISYPVAKRMFGRDYLELPKDLAPGIKQYVTREFRKNGIYSYLVVPYGDKKNPIGLFTFSDCRRKRDWTQLEIDTLLEIVNIIDLKSDQIRAQQEIFDSANRLKEAQTLGKIGSWEYDVGKQEIVWSDETYRLYERDPQLGPPSPAEEAEYYDPEQAKQLREYSRQAIEKGQSFSYDIEAHLPGGGTKYFSATMKPVIDKKGNVVRLQGTVQDITERKRAEDELRESEAKFRTFFEQSRDMIYISSKQGEFIDINQAGLDLFGYSRKEIQKVNIADLYADSTDRIDLTGTLERQGFIRDYEVQLKRKNGELIDCLVTSVLRYENQDNVIGYQGIIRDITARKQQEREYRKLFIAMEQSPISIVITNTDLTIEYVNPQFRQLTGYFNDEIIGQKPNILQSGHTSEAEWAKIWEMISSGDTWRGEFLNKKKNGELFWEDVTLGPIKNETGEITHFISLNVNITARKKTEQELQCIHNIYRQTIESAGGVPYQLSYDNYTYDFVGSGIQKLVGIEVAKFTPDKLDKIIRTQVITDPETSITSVKEYGEAFRKGRTNHYQLDIEIETAKGEQKWISDFATPLLDEKTGEVIGSLGILQDVTDRKMVEAELQFRLQLEELVSRISTGFINVDVARADTEIDKALRMIGQFAGVDRCYVFLFSEDGKFMDNTHEWCAEGVEAQKGNLQNLSVDIFPWWMERLRNFEEIHIPRVDQMPPEAAAEREILQAQNIQSLVVIPLVYGETLKGFLGLDAVKQPMNWDKEDINLRRTIGDIFTNALMHKQAEIEKQRIQEQLFQSQKMEAVGTLAGGVAHDFNNLLTVIQGNAQLMMLDIENSSPYNRELKQIINASTRAASLTRQLLLFSRKQFMEFAPMNLNDTIKNLTKMLNRLIGEDIAVTMKLSDDLWLINADESNLEQVIVNLTVNARDAMPKGGNLIIKTENRSLTDEESVMINEAYRGKFVLLSVEDNGTGIDPEHLPKIFEPFYTTKETGKGTGLGLSVVYGIIKKHNGWVNVYSEPGKGTLFKIYLPAIKTGTARQAAEEQDLIQLSGHGERVLVIEDETGVKEFAVSVLRQHGYTPFEAANADEARKVFKAEKGKFDLILSDVVLPDGNGFDLIDELLAGKADIPVIMCSGYTEERIKQSAARDKDYAFLQKPYSVGDMLETAKKLVNR